MGRTRNTGQNYCEWIVDQSTRLCEAKYVQHPRRLQVRRLPGWKKGPLDSIQIRWCDGLAGACCTWVEKQGCGFSAHFVMCRKSKKTANRARRPQSIICAYRDKCRQLSLQSVNK